MGWLRRRRVCLMTKPQALPFILPFAAWFWAPAGWRGFRAGAIGLAVIVVLWLPFVPAGGPRNYLRNLATTRTTIFPCCRCVPGTSGGWSRSRP